MNKRSVYFFLSFGFEKIWVTSYACLLFRFICFHIHADGKIKISCSEFIRSCIRYNFFNIKLSEPANVATSFMCLSFFRQRP